MTKIDGRSKEEAAKQLDESLRRLQVDHVDLVQHHEVLRFEDPHRIFHEEGANAALLEAREAGKLRYIGFTGHKDPHIHLHTLDVAADRGFAFDTVQMPLNLMDAHYRSFRADGAAPARRGGHRCTRDEEHGRRPPPRDGRRDAHRVPALRARPADLGRDHRHREYGAARPGARGGAHVPSPRPTSGVALCWRGQRRPRSAAASSPSRRRLFTTPPPRTRRGSGRSRRPSADGLRLHDRGRRSGRRQAGRDRRPTSSHSGGSSPYVMLTSTPARLLRAFQRKYQPTPRTQTRRTGCWTARVNCWTASLKMK